MILLLAIIILSMILVLKGLYLYFKTSKALLVFQQGGYSNIRMNNYIKKHYKYCYGINELGWLVAPIIMFINPQFAALALLVMFFFSYYNLYFYNFNQRRYTQKLGLNVTKRIKRLIVSISLIIIFIFTISILILYYFGYNFLTLEFYLYLDIIFTLIIYFIFYIVMLANFINKPIEKMVQNHYLQLAQNKLQANHKLAVIGITGSFGKTSTKNILGTILGQKYPTLITPNSYNTPMGLCICINNQLNNLYRYFIAEMGAYYQGDIKELVDFVKPKYGIVTGIGNQHLETFKSIQTTLQTKMELIEGLDPQGLGIINQDDPYISKYQIKNNVLIKRYSLKDPQSDIYAYDLKYLASGMMFKIKFNNQEYEIKTRLLGKHNVANILPCILLAHHLGYDMPSIIKAISKINSVEHRLALKQVNHNTLMIDDAFNANEQGIKESIKILGNYSQYRILITPGLIDLGTESEKVHQALGSYLTNYVDEVLIVSKENYDALLQGIKATNFDLKQVKYYDNFIDAYNYALSKNIDKVILVANDLPDKFNN